MQFFSTKNETICNEYQYKVSDKMQQKILKDILLQTIFIVILRFF